MRRRKSPHDPWRKRARRCDLVSLLVERLVDSERRQDVGHGNPRKGHRHEPPWAEASAEAECVLERDEGARVDIGFEETLGIERERIRIEVFVVQDGPGRVGFTDR